MQSISTNNLFMHGHEKWRGQATLLAPIRKSEGVIVPFAPAVPRSMISVKVADTNHESRRHKSSRHAEIFSTKSGTSSQFFSSQFLK